MEIYIKFLNSNPAFGYSALETSSCRGKSPGAAGAHGGEQGRCAGPGCPFLKAFMTLRVLERFMAYTKICIYIYAHACVVLELFIYLKQNGTIAGQGI